MKRIVTLGLLFSRSGSYARISEACLTGAENAIARINADPARSIAFDTVSRDSGAGLFPIVYGGAAETLPPELASLPQRAVHVFIATLLVVLIVLHIAAAFFYPQGRFVAADVIRIALVIMMETPMKIRAFAATNSCNPIDRTLIDHVATGLQTAILPDGQIAMLAPDFGTDLRGTLGIGRWTEALDAEGRSLIQPGVVTARDDLLGRFKTSKLDVDAAQRRLTVHTWTRI